ncbi:hypothetical protein I180019D1_29490 [Alistipes sp. i18-0019-D1]
MFFRFSLPAAVIAAAGRVYKSDPPLNPLLGGDFVLLLGNTAFWTITPPRLFSFGSAAPPWLLKPASKAGGRGTG